MTLLLTVMWMQTLLDYGIERTTMMTVALKAELAMFYSSAVVPFFGLLSFKMELHSAQ